VVSIDSLREAIDRGNGKTTIESAFIKEGKAVQDTESLQEILQQVASHAWPIPVVNDDGKYLGVVSKNRFLKTLYRAETGTHFEEQESGKECN